MRATSSLSGCASCEARERSNALTGVVEVGGHEPLAAGHHGSHGGNRLIRLGRGEAGGQLAGVVVAAQTEVGLHQQRGDAERLQIVPHAVEPDHLVLQHVDDLGQVPAAQRAQGDGAREVGRHRVEAVDDDVDPGPVEQPPGVVMQASAGTLDRGRLVRSPWIPRDVEGLQQLDRLTHERMGAYVVTHPGQPTGEQRQCHGQHAERPCLTGPVDPALGIAHSRERVHQPTRAQQRDHEVARVVTEDRVRLEQLDRLVHQRGAEIRAPLVDARSARQVRRQHGLLRIGPVGNQRGAVGGRGHAVDVVEQMAGVEELAQRSDEQTSRGQARCLLEELTGAGKRAMRPLEQPQRDQDARSGFGTYVGAEHLGRQPSSTVGVTGDVGVLRRRGQPVTSQTPDRD